MMWTVHTVRSCSPLVLTANIFCLLSSGKKFTFVMGHGVVCAIGKTGFFNVIWMISSCKENINTRHANSSSQPIGRYKSGYADRVLLQCDVERHFVYRKSCVHISSCTLFRDSHSYQADVWIATHELIHSRLLPRPCQCIIDRSCCHWTLYSRYWSFWKCG